MALRFVPAVAVLFAAAAATLPDLQEDDEAQSLLSLPFGQSALPAKRTPGKRTCRCLEGNAALWYVGEHCLSAKAKKEAAAQAKAEAEKAAKEAKEEKEAAAKAKAEAEKAAKEAKEEKEAAAQAKAEADKATKEAKEEKEAAAKAKAEAEKAAKGAKEEKEAAAKAKAEAEEAIAKAKAECEAQKTAAHTEAASSAADLNAQKQVSPCPEALEAAEVQRVQEEVQDLKAMVKSCCSPEEEVDPCRANVQEQWKAGIDPHSDKMKCRKIDYMRDLIMQNLSLDDACYGAAAVEVDHLHAHAQGSCEVLCRKTGAALGRQMAEACCDGPNVNLTEVVGRTWAPDGFTLPGGRVDALEACDEQTQTGCLETFDSTLKADATCKAFTDSGSGEANPNSNCNADQRAFGIKLCHRYHAALVD